MFSRIITGKSDWMGTVNIRFGTVKSVSHKPNYRHKSIWTPDNLMKCAPLGLVFSIYTAFAGSRIWRFSLTDLGLTLTRNSPNITNPNP